MEHGPHSSKSSAIILLALVLCSGVLCLPVSPPTQVQEGATFQGLGQPADGMTYTMAVAVSGDGNVVLAEDVTPGSSNGDVATAGVPVKAIRWENGVASEIPLPSDTSLNSVDAISRDGSAVTLTLTSAQHTQAFRWMSSEGFVALGDLSGGSFASLANGISADGSVIVGASFTNQNHVSREAFRWTSAQGMSGLGDLPGGSFYSAAVAVSADGSVVVGTGTTDTSNAVAFRWTADTGMVALSGLPEGHTNTNPVSVSADGSVIVGNIYAFADQDSRWEAFRWTEADGLVGLGDLPGGLFESNASAASADGAVVVGTSMSDRIRLIPAWLFPFIVSIPEDPAQEFKYIYEAFIWDQAHGMRNLRDLLVNNYGLDLTGWTLTAATAISEDGLTIVGNGTNPDGQPEPWIAHLPAPPGPSSCTSREYHRYYFDQPLPLTLDATRIALYAPAGISDQATNELAGVGIDLSSLVPHGVPGWHLAPLPAEKADACGVEDVVAALAVGTAFDFVTPVFLDDEGGPILITQNILAGFEEGVSSEQAAAILNEVDVGDNVYQPWPGLYHLRNQSKNGFDVLSAANRLAEQQGVLYAEPDFIIMGHGD